MFDITSDDLRKSLCLRRFGGIYYSWIARSLGPRSEPVIKGDHVFLVFRCCFDPLATSSRPLSLGSVSYYNTDSILTATHLHYQARLFPYFYSLYGKCLTLPAILSVCNCYSCIMVFSAYQGHTIVFR